jgi:hypothetical protein
MMAKSRSFYISLAVLIVEGLVAAYVGVVAFLLSSWSVNDDTAFRMETTDWWVAAGARLAEWLLIAAIGGALAYLVNWSLKRALKLSAKDLPKQGALLVGGLIGAASLAGCIYFLIVRPFM